MSELVAVFCSGVFFGVALYISLVQQPATLELGAPFSGRFFPPMYRRAARMQVTLAALGTLSSLWAWGRGAGRLWLCGALLLLAVVAFTVLRIRPVNDQLLAPGPGAETEVLLRRWGSLHAVRTVLSGLAFAALLVALASR